MGEWIVPPAAVQNMENESWQDSALSEDQLGFLNSCEREYYGIPLSDPESLFSAPLTVQWDLTSRCNLSCKHCYADATAEIGVELTSAQAFRLVEEAERIGILAFHLLGGEPFVRTDLVDVVQHACRLGIACHISSNGTLIRPHHAKGLEGLQNLTVDVSIDSTRPVYHDWLRGQEGAYYKAVDGIHHLRERDVQAGTTCTIYPDTLDEMEAIVHQAIDLGAHRLQFLYVSPVGRAQRHRDELLLDESEIDGFVANFKYLVTEYADKILIDSPVVPFEPDQLSNKGMSDGGLWLTGCLGGIDKMAIRSDGSVTACPQLKREYGNVQVSRMQDIWRDLHSSRLTLLGQSCDACDFVGYCGGGCPAPNSDKDELAPCYGRKQKNAASLLVTESDTAAWCPADCSFPCACPTWCSLPCPCPTHCSFPCDCPTWCKLPCPAPCASPCRFPCALPCPQPR
jgi:radical SAM protein with 4Fe4S-binding SPASM domain